LNFGPLKFYGVKRSNVGLFLKSLLLLELSTDVNQIWHKVRTHRGKKCWEQNFEFLLNLNFRGVQSKRMVIFATY